MKGYLSAGSILSSFSSTPGQPAQLQRLASSPRHIAPGHDPLVCLGAATALFREFEMTLWLARAEGEER